LENANIACFEGLLEWDVEKNHEPTTYKIAAKIINCPLQAGFAGAVDGRLMTSITLNRAYLATASIAILYIPCSAAPVATNAFNQSI
jgi:hypothetical protein